MSRGQAAAHSAARRPSRSGTMSRRRPARAGRRSAPPWISSSGGGSRAAPCWSVCTNQQRLGVVSKVLGIQPDPKIARDRMAAARELNHDIECFLGKGLSLSAARSETRRVAGELAWMLGQAYFQAFAIAANGLGSGHEGLVPARGLRPLRPAGRGGRELSAGAEREAAFKRQALELERRDGGHSLARHGPEVSPAALERRIRTGVAPDGKVSPTAGSSRFVSHEEWVKTRETAWRAIQETYGVDLARPPTPGGAPEYVIVVEHNRVIDDGFIGVGARVKAPNPRGAKPVRVYRDTQAVRGVTRTSTRATWSEASGRWKIAQHFPEVRGWDQSGQAYSPSENPDYIVKWQEIR